MTELEFLIEQNNYRPDTPPVRLISEWVEGRRILPAASPLPGPWRNQVTPYSVEIMDNMSPYNPCQIQAIMKARKLGLTTAIENCVAYYISEVPAEQLYSTANEQLAKDWSSKKISHVIDSLGIRHKLIAADQNAKSRRTGDRMFTKEYVGGALDIITASSMMARRALDKRCLWIDETDGIAPLTSTGEGLWSDILIAHTNSYGARRKVSIFSSPTTDEASLIKQYYDQGDQRKFLVPCPVCGRHIELKLNDEQTAYGLKAETKAGKIIDAYYLCEYCAEPIYNNDKRKFYSDKPRCKKYPQKALEPARWEPTKKTDPIRPSYQMNALYSPLGMLTFREIAEQREKKETEGPEGMRSWINIYAGLTFKDAASRPRLEAVINHRGSYPRGTVPAGVLFLTMAIDVQRGSSRDPNNPPRVELEVMGTGAGYRTWSIEYRVFPGETDDPYSGAWEDLYQWMKSINGFFYSAEGIPFRVEMIGIDSGDAAEGRSEVVYRFAERWSPYAFPLKGFAQLAARRGEKTDIPGAGSFKKYRLARIGGGGEYVIEVSTAFYKSTLFGRLNIEPYAPSRPGYCEFPRDYPDDYFVQLTNSERRNDGSYRDIGAHEALDCRIYNLMLSDAYLDNQVNLAKEKRRAAGMNPMTVDLMTNSRFILDQLQAQIDSYGATRP
ncbi:MAG: phage terminase large subunit family protein [Treponema sp.]|jgi:phage terminase large subunit GpA-like protein|nr:phage terminase large subunit family protein [Treponema sp.]